MGRVATEASNTFPFREWAARLATKAPERDYRAQLEALYNGILERWRYVQEPDEWIHGTPKSLIRHVLGTKYNAPHADPLQTSLAKIPTKEKGWGDCDDVSTVVAAGARALGMRPFFRVARGPAGAHVSVLVRTPSGEFVSVDPVGHPKHPFGWALQTDDVRLFDLAGGSVSKGALGKTDEMQDPTSTFYTDFRGRPFAKAGRTHWAATHPSDARGPRALAIPMRHHRLMKHGVVMEGCPAYDSFGTPYTYDTNRDLWIDDRLLSTSLGGIDEAFGGVRRRRKRRGRQRASGRGRGRGGRARRRSRRKKRRATIRRVVSRVAKPMRKIQARIMKSPAAQAAASSMLVSVGVPPAATRAVLQASGEILERGGLPALVRMLRRDPRAAARLVAKAAQAGVRKGVAGRFLKARMGAVDAPGTGYMLQQGGREFFAQPICALAGVPGLYEMGALEVTSTPTQGQWYRIQRGDSLLKVAQRAYPGASRLSRSKWVNNVRANAVYHRNTKEGFEANSYGDGIISFSPQFAEDPEAAIQGGSGRSYAVIFLPVAPGDEPPEIVPDVPDVVEPEVEVEPDVEPDVEPEVEVEPPVLPPVEPVVPVEPEVDVTEPDVVEPAVPTEQELCEQRGGSWRAHSNQCFEACPPGQVNAPDGGCMPIPVTQKQACEDAGNFWNDIRSECEMIPTGPGDCPPGTEWDEDEQDCFVPDEVTPVDPIEPTLPDIPDMTIPPVTPPVLPPVQPPATGTLAPFAILGVLLALGDL